MNNQKEIDQLEKYLNGQLDGIELRRFRNKLKKEDWLQKRLELELELNDALNEESDYNIYKEIVGQASKDYFSSKRSNSVFTPLRVAASVALLIASGWAVWWVNRPLSPDQIHDQYFEPYIIQTTPRGITDESDAFMMATIHYRDKEFSKAIDELEIALSNDPNDYRALLMLGISHQALKNYSKAESILLDLIRDDNHLFLDQARWYLGLLYLTDKDIKNDIIARELFMQITDSTLQKQVKKLP